MKSREARYMGQHTDVLLSLVISLLVWESGAAALPHDASQASKPCAPCGHKRSHIHPIKPLVSKTSKNRCVHTQHEVPMSNLQDSCDSCDKLGSGNTRSLVEEKQAELGPLRGRVKAAHCIRGGGGTRFPALYPGITVAMGAFVWGYDTGMTTGALLSIIPSFGLEARPGALGVVATTATAGSFTGTLSAGRLADYLGRRGILIAAACCSLLGSGIASSATQLETLLKARLLSGFAIGIYATVVPIYAAECAAKESRGAIMSLPQLGMSSGIACAYITSVAALLCDADFKRMFAAVAVPALLLLLLVLSSPESPRFLLRRGERAGALMSLRRLRCLETLSTQVLAIVLVVPLMDVLGRRKVLLSILPILVSSLVALSLALDPRVTSVGPRTAVAALLIYQSAFSCSLGPLPSMLSAELLPNHARAAGMSFLLSVCTLSNMAVSSSWPYLQARFGSSNILLAYAFTTCVAYGFFYCFVPETSGLALEAAQ